MINLIISMNEDEEYPLTFEEVIEKCTPGDILQCLDGSLVMVVRNTDDDYSDSSLLLFGSSPNSIPQIVKRGYGYNRFKKMKLNTIEFKYT